MGRGAAGAAYEDHGLVFCDEIGRPCPPDRISAWFKRAAADAGLPVIRMHDERYTAATLGLEADLDIKIVSAQLGHSAAAKVTALIPRKAAQ
jgi:integrase